MKELLTQLMEHKSLHKKEAEEALHRIARGEFNQSQLAAFLTVFMMRPITVEELQGFRDALLELCLKVDLGGMETIDLCGTGGDGKNTFNISTLASFVVAGAGIKVAKHGNYGVSSVSGSSNVMEYLGYRFTNKVSDLQQQIEQFGICFMHAPLFHPAMKMVASARKELGMKTFFNMLGPLVNPAFPTYQLTGVFSLELLRLYHYLLEGTDRKFMLVHSLDGYDELSLTSSFRLISNTREQLLEPEEIGLKRCLQRDLEGGDTVEESARIFTDILNGKGTAVQQDVVCANAALAICCTNPALSMEDALAQARESLVSKNALNVFKKLLRYEYA
ncbi:MAG TPA: anthranilate phosphoribosyltransferase [Bacteroidia bacterium]|jgi:anthranilate phosphoribosyltransferase|nr:anthranilate phosphoribosyltransferase [Bacteroidia bacterium]